MGLGTACKEETSRMKNVLIKSFGGKKLCLWVEENCVFTEKFLYTHIIIIMYVLSFGVLEGRNQNTDLNGSRNINNTFLFSFLYVIYDNKCQ
jgi:hypothetical protein